MQRWPAQTVWTSELELLTVAFGAHRDKRGCDNHRQENQSESEIVDQGEPPVLPCWAVCAS